MANRLLWNVHNREKENATLVDNLQKRSEIDVSAINFNLMRFSAFKAATDRQRLTQVLFSIYELH